MVMEGVAETGHTKPHQICLGNDEYGGRADKEISCGVDDRHNQETIWNPSWYTEVSSDLLLECGVFVSPAL